MAQRPKDLEEVLEFYALNPAGVNATELVHAHLGSQARAAANGTSAQQDTTRVVANPATSRAVLLPAVVVPAVAVALLLLLGLAAALLWRRRQQLRAAAAKEDQQQLGQAAASAEWQPRSSSMEQRLAAAGLTTGRSAASPAAAAAAAPLLVVQCDPSNSNRPGSKRSVATGIGNTPSSSTPAAAAAAGGSAGSPSDSSRAAAARSSSSSAAAAMRDGTIIRIAEARKQVLELHQAATPGSSSSSSRLDRKDAAAAAAGTDGSRRVAGLVLHELVGEGSYGKVFKAAWRGARVAVKVMVLPAYMSGSARRQHMAVMEAAISSSLSHPNIVQTYTYGVEPVRANTILRAQRSGFVNSLETPAHTSSNAAGCLQEHGGDGSSDDYACKDSGAFSWEVHLLQEFCDGGSLKAALEEGRFRAPDGSLLLASLLATALDVARAMAYLHSHNILHSDLKAGNVMLRSAAGNTGGCTAKVADFGLSRVLGTDSTHISNAIQGTLSHMAPETLLQGQVSRASDVFAFGILMFQLYTGSQPYNGIPRALLGHKVARQGLRPQFPPGTPFEWQLLACRCWEGDPAIRPSFPQIIEELNRMSHKMEDKDGNEGHTAAAVAATPGSSRSAAAAATTAAAFLGSTSTANGTAAAATTAPREEEDTLHTSADQALWEEFHRETLLQQQLRQQERQQQAHQQQCKQERQQQQQKLEEQLPLPASSAVSAADTAAGAGPVPGVGEAQAHHSEVLTRASQQGDTTCVPAGAHAAAGGCSPNVQGELQCGVSALQPEVHDEVQGGISDVLMLLGDGSTCTSTEETVREVRQQQHSALLQQLRQQQAEWQQHQQQLQAALANGVVQLADGRFTQSS